MKSIAADIGGTNGRFALMAEDGTPLATHDYTIAEFSGMDSLLARFLRETSVAADSVSQVVLAVAGPVQNGAVELTNVGWRVNVTELAAGLPRAEIHLINDFQAAALGVLSLKPADMLTLNARPRRNEVGDIAVVLGAGTGLGTAFLQRRSSGGFRTLASEAGHMDYAPAAPELALYAHLQQRFGHVSWERLVSGQGLADIYAFHAGSEASAQEVNARAVDGEPHALKAVQVFVRAFAAYAGDLALALKPAGGLFLVGGMTAKMQRWFDPETFVANFADKGRFADLARSFAVSLVRNERTGLLGAIAYGQTLGDPE